MKAITSNTCFLLVLTHLIHHDFTEYNSKDSTPSIWNSCCFDVEVTSVQRLWTIKMQARIEKGVVQSSDGGTFVRWQ